jgi:hypothetical protein
MKIVYFGLTGLVVMINTFVLFGNLFTFRQLQEYHQQPCPLPPPLEAPPLQPCPLQKKEGENVEEREKVEVVVFIPTPIDSEDRRQYVHAQFIRDKAVLKERVAPLLFVYGTKTGPGNSVNITPAPTTRVVSYVGAENIEVPCRDFGDEPNNPDDTSGTTCKVYEALRYISRRFEAAFVWRGADDSYLNLRFFFSDVITTLPPKRLYYGRLRRSAEYIEDLQVARHPRLQALFGIAQWGQYMSGMGYMVSGDVADFIAALTIPPHLTWCEDLMVGMWLNPFQIQFMHGGELFHEQGERPAEVRRDYVLIHRMTPAQWELIDERSGRLN